jgi:hypothetical protein
MQIRPEIFFEHTTCMVKPEEVKILPSNFLKVVEVGNLTSKFLKSAEVGISTSKSWKSVRIFFSTSKFLKSAEVGISTSKSWKSVRIFFSTSELFIKVVGSRKFDFEVGRIWNFNFEVVEVGPDFFFLF